MQLLPFLRQVNPSPNTRLKRSTALLVLLVWLFAASAAWANACFLETRGAQAHDLAVKALHATTASKVSAGHVGAIAGDDGRAHDANASCLNVVDDWSPPLATLQYSLDPTEAAIPVDAVVVWPAAPTMILVRSRFDGQHLQGIGPPLRVRFSRLAL